MSMNPWLPEPNPKIRRRVGKLGEECAELLVVINRIAIQGIDGVDPKTGKTNRQALMEECADVAAQIRVTDEAFDFDRAAWDERVDRKVAQMAEWEALVGCLVPAEPTEAQIEAGARSMAEEHWHWDKLTEDDRARFRRRFMRAMRAALPAQAIAQTAVAA